MSYDLAYLQAAVGSLEKYLISKEIYWTIGASSPPGEPPFPQLTLGGLLLAQKRLAARRLFGQESTKLEKINRELWRLQNRWKMAWQQKAIREFHARLILWRDYLEDYRSQPDNHVDRYAYEVGRRVMLELLGAEAEGIPQIDLELLKTLDTILKAEFIKGDMIWDAELAPGFPEDLFWYLYGHMRGEHL